MSQQPQTWNVEIPEFPTPIPMTHPSGGNTNFILVRHGRTEGNVRQMVVGRLDIPLDELGEKQAAAVGAFLGRTHKPDLVVSSPLIRAHNTARAIAAQYDMPLSFDEDLMELNFGAYEGLTLEEIKERDPEFIALAGDLDHDVSWPMGERLSEFHPRVMGAFMRLAGSYDHHTIVVVSHGGVLGSFTSQLLGTHPNDWVQFQIQNCSVTHIELGPQGSVFHCLNETSHLADINAAHQ